MSKKALKDLPLQEITLRKYEEPSSLDQRELVKKFCLSIGLLQPGDSRDIVVDIFLELIKVRKGGKILEMRELLDLLKNKDGASPSNIRRQLRRLKALKLVEKLPEGYRITESGSIEPILDNYIVQFLVNPSLERIRSYVKKIDEI
ncbi:MAG: hypothetical protein JSW73_02765 [Candidatus Woesearchaeota archaeon]|nr:MAG: hypothetical protein JSW73_02765 [Candidatus Woesearchaeota archaeon]